MKDFKSTSVIKYSMHLVQDGVIYSRFSKLGMLAVTNNNLASNGSHVVEGKFQNLFYPMILDNIFFHQSLFLDSSLT